MKNAFLRYGLICAPLLVVGALTVTSASAQSRELATVNFPQPVAVAAAILPAGNYMINEAGIDAFLIQPENGRGGVLVLGRRTDAPANASTEAILKNDGEHLRLDKLVIGEYATVYDFVR